MGCDSLVVHIQNDSTGKLFVPLVDSSGGEAPAAVPLASSKPPSAQDLAIQNLVARKIMTGYPDGDPRPNESVTRAQFASLVSAANLYWQRPLVNPPRQFNDIANHWAKDAIARAARLNFLSGYPDGRFGPEDRIPRQQAIAALVGGLGLPIPSDTQGVLNKRYQDANQIDNWARANIAAAVQAGLLNDTGTDLDSPRLSPKQAATRGETASLIAKSFDLPALTADRDVFGQPDPDPNEPAYRGPEVRISPQTTDVTLVQVDASEESGTIEVNSLTGLVKVTAQASPNAVPMIAYLQAGQRFRYEIRDEIQPDKKTVSRYEGFKTVIEQKDRRSIIESPEMQSFLDDWVPEAEALPRAEYEKLFNDRLLTRDPKNSLNAAIVQAMKDLGKFSTLPFIAPTEPGKPPAQPGENSCGWAVNQVLAQARIESLDTYVPRVRKLLDGEPGKTDSRGTKIDPKQAQAGDIVIAPPELKNGKIVPDSEPHMGVCISPTTVRSASKSQPNRPFGWETNLNFDGYFGTTPSTIYRLKS
ncbi:S-layer homology domain-containing protein [Alkalinema sp. FACHB-956]|uniref:S-layer homology domain-containing protein n=1 Tax=Alkalinema sp. FACHB-956 TaxID=2692768 RepID=UPI0016839470|nr:S-layer homology domain-containing protein [Alkalinema sp. FACHB-956]MBD2325800.1 S-layer homology domain-containing protein [Alkalinema sp. FACHB-956]